MRESIAYTNWFNSTFNNAEKEVLSSIGIECEADHKFFKSEILDIAGNLTNYKLKREVELYEKFIDRYIQLIPKYLHSQIDREKLKKDKYYSAWFFNRHCFFELIKQAQENFRRQNGAREYLLWSPLIDNFTPDECKSFENKVFHCMDDKFLEAAVEHWLEVKQGCRCSLLMSKAP